MACRVFFSLSCLLLSTVNHAEEAVRPLNFCRKNTAVKKNVGRQKNNKQQKMHIIYNIYIVYKRGSANCYNNSTSYTPL